MKLHAFGGHLHGQIRGAQFGKGGFQAEVCISAINQISQIIQPAFDHHQFTRQICKRELVGLKIENSFARLHPFIAIGDHVTECGPRNPAGVSGNRWPGFVQRSEQYFQPVTWIAQQIGARHPRVIEGQRTSGRTIVPHLPLFGDDAETFSTFFNNQGGYRFLGIVDF